MRIVGFLFYHSLLPLPFMAYRTRCTPASLQATLSGEQARVA